MSVKQASNQDFSKRYFHFDAVDSHGSKNLGSQPQMLDSTLISYPILSWLKKVKIGSVKYAQNLAQNSFSDFPKNFTYYIVPIKLALCSTIFTAILQ